MDFFFNFFTTFSEPETASEPSIPLDSDASGDNGGGCTVA
jgi:hypothetical protein